MTAPLKRKLALSESVRADRAVTLKAWRLTSTSPRYEALPVALPDYIETVEEAAQHACLHAKEGIAVLRSDAAQRPERRHLLSIFVVKRKSNPGGYRDGRGKWRTRPAEYPALISEVCVPTDCPFVEPADVMADPIGRDRTLVEG